ncbi:MAG: dTDP-4-dehydrorhamnose reductase [Flavobacteriaceae bacterium]|nr:dTDP-4-dehydrorhamnose reductase [Flavobacteriaceae bacterium]
MYNILVTGSNGQLGSELRELSRDFRQYQFFFTDLAELDVTDKNVIQKLIVQNQINSIINCAAYTAVDKAESEPEMADKINHIAVKNLAEAAKTCNCKIIHISTDYVFDGTNHQPYIETDAANPQSVYGSTKLAGELALMNVNPRNSIIIRTSWVYSSYGNNFVKTMLKQGKERDELNVIDDQIGTPTYAKDLALVILETLPLLTNEKVEIYHFSNEGVCSWYDFAKAIFELTDTTLIVNPIKTAQYPTVAKRPHYSILNKSKIKETFSITIPHWKKSLKECLNKLDNKNDSNI